MATSRGRDASRAGMLQSGAQALWRSLSPLGLVAGALCLAASLTPSLIPRGSLLQGALAGVSLAVGYAFGVLAERVWRYLELPPLPERLLRP